MLVVQLDSSLGKFGLTQTTAINMKFRIRQNISIRQDKRLRSVNMPSQNGQKVVLLTNKKCVATRSTAAHILIVTRPDGLRRRKLSAPLQLERGFYHRVSVVQATSLGPNAWPVRNIPSRYRVVGVEFVQETFGSGQTVATLLLSVLMDSTLAMIVAPPASYVSIAR